MRVFFGTNRLRTPECAGAADVARAVPGACRPDRFYGGLPVPLSFEAEAAPGSDLEVGMLRVTFPPGHVPGRIERPLTVLTIQMRDEDPSRDVVISELRAFPDDYEGWARELRSAGRKHAFVYVHGYATRFDEAARRAAQIAYDLDFDLDDDFRGVPMLYSWPSRGETGAYLADADAVVEAVHAFNRFLDLIKQQGGIERIHVIAHSMGNQLVANALGDRAESSGRVVDELVLAAPDIWASRFKQRFLRTLPRRARRVTLYVSDRDRALSTSSRIREGEPRAGQVAGGLLTAAPDIEGFDAVDASGLETDFLGHSYYANNDSMLSDIYCLLKGVPAEGRPLLVLAGTAWRFRPPAERLAVNTAECAVLVPPDEPGSPAWVVLAAAGLLTALGLGTALAVVARRRRKSRA